MLLWVQFVGKAALEKHFSWVFLSFSLNLYIAATLIGSMSGMRDRNGSMALSRGSSPGTPNGLSYFFFNLLFFSSRRGR